MSFKSTILAAVAASAFALPAFAADIMVQDPYARSSAMMATSGAAFMQIMNHGETDDRLIGAASPVAENGPVAHPQRRRKRRQCACSMSKRAFPLPQVKR